MVAKTMDQLVSLCKRRGFIFQNADIYGGLQGVYDYGPLGVELKNNLKSAWWRAMVYERDDIEGLDAAILTNRKVLHYSGHEDTFSDPMTDCKKCKGRFRADHIKDGKCPNCGSTELTEPRPFNLMFKPPSVRLTTVRFSAICVRKPLRRFLPSSATSLTPPPASCRSASPKSASLSATKLRRATSFFAFASLNRRNWNISLCRAKTKNGMNIGRKPVSNGGKSRG